MARDFSELARVWVETFGRDIARIPRHRLVEIANKCIQAEIVHSMDPVRPEEMIYLAAAVDIALDNQDRDNAKADAGMPKLIGTAKQILWADLIRSDAIAAARLLRQRVMQQMDEMTVIRIDKYVAFVLRMESKAKWFIDNRTNFVQFPMITNRTAYSTQPGKTVPMGKAEKNARDEMTLHSTNEKRMGAVELISSGNGLLAVFARDADFMDIIRNKHLEWDAGVHGWRQKNDDNESAADQIANLASALLAEGFTVMVSNDEARGKAQEDANEL